MKRRDFLVRTGAAAAGAMLPAALLDAAPYTWPAGDEVALVRDPADAVAGTPAAHWAFDQLRQALAARGASVKVVTRLGDAPGGARCVVVAGAGTALSREARVALPAAAEALALVPGRLGEREVLFALGSDGRGLSYALTELADAVALGLDPAAVLRPRAPVVQQPANRVRSVIRLFTSDVEDKPWYNDRGFWRRYFDMLAAQRFNRFNLSFGLGYDVRATNLPDSERDRNLEMLRDISREATARGLDFQLGLWTHAYRWIDSPHANHVIEGLTPQTHAAYCRDALALLLRDVPDIASVTIRIHGESGVPEGSYGFWRTVFQGLVRGRKVPLDLHAKGMDQPTLDAALAIGVPLTISPKFSAEHMGLPYHQAAIRPTEIPTGRPGQGPFTHSEGDRSFTRYGYGDLLRENRRYAVVHRIWPGTQRMLLWGSPAFTAAYGRRIHFCGTDGGEVFDPLSFKGRKGSGLPGGRDGYADLSLRAPGDDFEKFRIGYRLWGRHFYDPDADPEVWRRQLRADYHAAAGAVETSLGRASRILPLVTTAHMPSAANNHYWPEMYVNMAIADPTAPVMPYPDTPLPRRFGTVSPLDPQLFSTIEEHADALLADRVSGKYSPVEVAQWLEDLARDSEQALATAQTGGNAHAPAFRRYAIDTRAVMGLGRFFAGKLRAGVLYAIHTRTGDAGALAAALQHYRAARAAYGRVADLTTGVYVKDVTYGPAWYQRGDWADRLAAIDRDIAAMESVTPPAPVVTLPPARVAALVTRVQGRPERPAANASHTPPPSFTRGQKVALLLTLPEGAPAPLAVVLHYRHTHQAQAWQEVATRASGRRHHAAIPAAYTDTEYPLEYYFEVTDTDGRAWIYPGLGAELTQQPYFVVRSTHA